jgi:DNA-damage-inducible protein J
MSKEGAMPATTMVHERVDEHIKAQASGTRAGMALTASDAVRVFLARIVADQELPFALKAPNASTRAAMKEARAGGKQAERVGQDEIDSRQKSAPMSQSSSASSRRRPFATRRSASRA